MNLLPLPPQEEKNQFIWWSWFKNIWIFCTQVYNSLYRNANNELSVSSVPAVFVPICTGQSGALITSYSTNCSFIKVGKLIFYSGEVYITTAGAAAGDTLSIQLPDPATHIAIGVAREDNVTGNLCQAIIRGSGQPLVVWTYNNGGVIQNGYSIKFSILYPNLN